MEEFNKFKFNELDKNNIEIKATSDCRKNNTRTKTRSQGKSIITESKQRWKESESREGKYVLLEE